MPVQIQVLLAIIIIAVSIYLRIKNPTKSSFASEAEYKQFCEKHNYIYVPNRYIRGLCSKKPYPQERVGFSKSKLRVNLGMFDYDGVWESLTVLAQTNMFDQIIFMQIYGSKEKEYNGVGYKWVTKEQINSMTSITSDRQFMEWLYQQEQIVVNGRGKELEVENVTNISLGIANFGLEIFDKLDRNIITDVLIGQGYVDPSQLIQLTQSLPNLENLFLSQIGLESTSGEQATIEMLNMLATICNNSKIEQLTVSTDVEISDKQLKEMLTRDVNIDLRLS